MDKVSRDLSHAGGAALEGHTPGPWRPISEAPLNGTPVWGFLHETGIRLLRWMTPEECAEYEGGDVEEYDGCWVEIADFDNEWSPDIWCSLEALPLPEILSARMRAAIAKASPHG